MTCARVCCDWARPKVPPTLSLDAALVSRLVRDTLNNPAEIEMGMMTRIYCHTLEAKPQPSKAKIRIRVETNTRRDSRTRLTIQPTITPWVMTDMTPTRPQQYAGHLGGKAQAFLGNQDEIHFEQHEGQPKPVVDHQQIAHAGDLEGFQ